MEKRRGHGSGPRDYLSTAKPVVLVLQNPGFGGAERSLLEELLRENREPLILLPARGPWSEEAERRGWAWRIIPRPKILDRLTLRGPKNARSLPRLPLTFVVCVAALCAAILYAFRLGRGLPRNGEIRTLGVKSHLAALLLWPWRRGLWVADIRDFIEPKALRKILAWVARRGGCRIIANSRAVAADYQDAEVKYPQVELARPPRPCRRSPGPRILTHVGYFAPYKGQDLFLRCAEAWLALGLDAEFWVVGDVVYPSPVYAEYRQALLDGAAKPALASRVKFWGALGAEGVQDILEQTHLLLHCSRDPEPYGRTVMEALLCGCQALCHRGSGVCETVTVSSALPSWLPPLPGLLGPDYVAVTLASGVLALPTGAELAEPLP